jgi:hypothetical protein
VGGTFATSANKLTTSLINIRAIISHFGPKIDAWSAVHREQTLSPENVLAVVRDNYDTLTLKLQARCEGWSARATPVGLFE